MRSLFIVAMIFSTGLFAQEEVCWNEGLCEVELFHPDNSSQKIYLGWQITQNKCQELTEKLIESLAEPISDELGYSKVTMIYEDKCKITKKDFPLNSSR